MKKFTLLSVFIMLFCAIAPSVNTYAYDTTSSSEVVMKFIQEISLQNGNYVTWKESNPIFGYELYGNNFETVVGNLYYIKESGVDKGYVIIDTDNSIVEFSLGKPAFDRYLDSNIQLTEDIKYLYINGMPASYNNGIYKELSLSGEVLNTVDTTRPFLPMYNPQIQTENCIVSAISNLIWHYSKNGYNLLVGSSESFKNVEKAVDTLMIAEGGHANANIPNTIKKYVKNKSSSYSATVTNQWNPLFTNVVNETNSRPCLLGFAKGSPYSDKDGHMTVCVGTITFQGRDYVSVIDGWSTSVVEKAWGTYNDFISKVTMNK